MKYVYGKKMKTFKDRLTTGIASLAILANSAGFALPFILTQKAAAATNYTTTEFTASELTNWVTDRFAPSGGSQSVSFGGRDNVLSVSIDNASGNTSDAIPGNNSDFYNTEGLKKDILDSDATKVDLYVDSAWLTKPVRAGLWGVGYDTSNVISAYPIVEFTTQGEGSFTGWRAWDGVNGGWTNLVGTAYDADDWNNIEVVLNHQTGHFDLYINGTLVKTYVGGGTTYIGEVILNQHNYETSPADDYTVHWSNLGTGEHVADTQTTSIVTVYGDTSAGENQPGWLFNRDTSTATPFELNSDEASIGNGSLYVQPIGTNPSDKFIGEFFALEEIANINGASYDFKIGSGGTAADANEFYMNVYANFGSSPAAKFYDCRYNVVPTVGSTSDFNTITFDPTESYPVAQSGSSPFACPSVPAEMNVDSVGSTIRAFSLNIGDTSANDSGLDGYLDKFVFNTVSEVTTYDFEPDTTAPAVPTSLHRVAADDAQVFACGANTNRQILYPTWAANTEPDFDHYEYTSYNPNGSIGLNEQVLTTNQFVHSWTPPTEETYGFKVRSVDASGNKSAWTDICYVTYDDTAPDQPQVLGIYKGHNSNAANLLSCGGVTNSTQIRIDWDDVDGAAYYWFGTKFNQKHAKVSTSQYDGNMTPGNNPYFYTVIAVDAAGNESLVSAQCSITLDQEAPDAFNVSPAHNSVVDGASVTQTWGSNAGDVDYFIYESYHDAGANNLRWHEEVSGTSKTATNVADSTYWWRVKAVDHAGNESAWSDLWKLSINNDIQTPAITAPATDNEAFGFPSTVVLGAHADAAANGGVQWAVRAGTCAAGTGTLFGNVDGHNDSYSWTSGVFSADVSGLVAGNYCFVFNPAGPTRLTRTFEIVNPLGASTDQPNSNTPTTPGQVLGLATGGQVLAESTGLAGTGTQNGGIILLAAASLMALALFIVRRKQEN